MLNINKNNLSSEKSLYLQQHKNNPVNWQTWSEEIFQISKEKNSNYFKYRVCKLSLVPRDGP